MNIGNIRTGLKEAGMLRRAAGKKAIREEVVPEWLEKKKKHSRSRMQISLNWMLRNANFWRNGSSGKREVK
ncbi:hypothetical protein RCO48_39065 [Peribacillus frigoritolerans]|nr:hypothetical protein [Peribacillus frigoritolerans]